MASRRNVAWLGVDVDMHKRIPKFYSVFHFLYYIYIMSIIVLSSAHRSLPKIPCLATDRLESDTPTQCANNDYKSCQADTKTRRSIGISMLSP